jgi:hypothetical protein
MSRFAVSRRGEIVEVAFDDGGMNLLSADALRELREVCHPERSEGSGRGGGASAGGARYRRLRAPPARILRTRSG